MLRIRRLVLLICVVVVSSLTTKAQLTINAGPDVAVCQGFSTQLGKTFSGGVPPYKFSWNPSNDLNDATSLNPVVTPTQAFTMYVVTVTDAIGSVASDTLTVTMNPRPIADAGASITTCVGSSIVLGAAQSARNGTGPYVFDWMYLPSDVTGPGTANPSYVATRAGYSRHVLHVIDAKGCEDWDTIYVLIKQPLSLAVGKGFEGCAFVPHEIGGLGIIGGGVAPYHYKWSPSRGLSSSTIPNPLAFPDTTTTYKVVVSDEQGCSIEDSVTVIIKPRMRANLKREYTICQGKEINLASPNFVTGGFSPYSYQWYSPVGEQLDRDYAPDPKVVPTGTGRLLFSVLITDAKGCELRDTVFVNMTGSPGATFVLQPRLCQNESLPYGVSGDTTFEYLWDVEGGTIQAGQGTQTIRIKWTRSGPGKIHLVVNDPLSGCSSSGINTTNVLPLPEPVITVRGNTKLCPGSTTTLDAGAGFFRYRWSNGQNSQKIVVDKSGEYSVVVFDSNGCSNVSPSVIITVVDAPNPQIMGSNKICGGVPILLHAPSGYTSYTWSTGERDSVITIIGPGKYKVFVVDTLGCSGESPVFTVDPRPVIVDKGGDVDFVSREIELRYPHQEVFFLNTTPEEILIDTLFLWSTNTDIELSKITLNSSEVPLTSIRGTRVKQNEKLYISVVYDPTYIDTNTYRVQVVVSTPCWDTVHIEGTIQSYDKRMWATASVPNIISRPGESVSIPLTIQFDSPQDSVEDASLDLSMRVNGYLLNVTDDSRGAIRSIDTLPNSWRVLHLHFDHLTIKYNSPFRLTDIHGLALASQKLQDTLFLDSRSVEWTEGSVLLKKPHVRTENGLLTLSSYCFPHDVVLGPDLPTTISVRPNPASDVMDVRIQAGVAGEYTVDIYAPEGRKLYSQRARLSVGSNTIRVDLNDFASGVYPLIINTPSRVEIQHVIINK